MRQTRTVEGFMVRFAVSVGRREDERMKSRSRREDVRL